MNRCVAVVLAGICLVATLDAAAASSDDAKVVSVHSQWMTPASNALFQAESTPPSTPGEWQTIVARARDLVRAAQALGSIPSVKGQNEWLQFARALGARAEQAARAAEAKDQDALVSANGEIVSVCEDCHTKYRDAGRSMQE